MIYTCNWREIENMSKMLAKSSKTRQVFWSSVNKRFGKKVKMKALKIKGTVIQIRKAIAKAQKGRSLNGCSKKTKHIKFSAKETFLTPWHTRTCAYQGVRNVCFSENLACFVFLKHPFWDSPFCLITDEKRPWKFHLSACY